ncbi:hypothetical protein AVEN_199501-1 [Araneus ventricosus]|uniref:Uncharacterized protein n=1 Tax=Araneus ventricosus TaxID=182803 RepID=A0A4Y1ZTZ3_ARAVE|nr:hypothetical protein AVEN_113362-1 [Araneus ventricosus]GBL67913.1 hypothetical protein AVEN_199501-1 [Araneus ventricosus]
MVTHELLGVLQTIISRPLIFERIPKCGKMSPAKQKVVRDRLLAFRLKGEVGGWEWAFSNASAAKRAKWAKESHRSTRKNSKRLSVNPQTLLVESGSFSDSINSYPL